MTANTAFAVLLNNRLTMTPVKMIDTVASLVDLIAKGDADWDFVERFNEYKEFQANHTQVDQYELYRLAANLWVAMFNFGGAQGLLSQTPPMIRTNTAALAQQIQTLCGERLLLGLQLILGEHNAITLAQFQFLETSYMRDVMKMNMKAIASITRIQAKL